MAPTSPYSAESDGLSAQSVLPILNHGVGAVVLQVGKDGMLSVLGQTYRRATYTTIRLPFRTARTVEAISETLRRVLFEEVSDQDANFAFKQPLSLPVYSQATRDDQTGQATHLKAFFVVTVVRGRLRRSDLIEDAGTPKEEIVGPPRWFEFASLINRMSRGNTTPPTHRIATASALVTLGETDEAIRRRYERIYAQCSREASPFRVPDARVLEYLSRFPG